MWGSPLSQGKGCFNGSALGRFCLCGIEEDLLWIQELMESWFEEKVAAMLGPEDKDDKEKDLSMII